MEMKCVAVITFHITITSFHCC